MNDSVHAYVLINSTHVWQIIPNSLRFAPDTINLNATWFEVNCLNREMQAKHRYTLILGLKSKLNFSPSKNMKYINVLEYQ